jgi:hypothetical protein
MSWRRSFVLLCVSLVFGGCGDQSDLVASLKTDFVPGTDFVAVRTEVRAVGSTTMRARDAVVSTGDDFFGGVPVATFALQNGEYDVRVVLLEAGGTELIARDIRASISGDLVLTALITRSCRDVTCPLPGEDASLTECSGRRCVAPRCVPGAPGCGEPTCTSDVDCAADTPIACVVGACIDGECLARPRDDLCSPAERCDAYRGCLLRPSTGDAGAGSACGTVDNNEDDLLPLSCLPR